MSCEFEEELTAFVDGELPPLLAKQVEGHVAGCAECAATVRQVRGAAAQLSLLGAQASAPSPALRRAVLSRLAEPVGLAATLRAFWRPAVLLPGLGLAMAATVAVVVLAARPAEAPLDSPEQALFAQVGDELVDFDVVGLESLDDLEVVQHLHELEATP